MARRSRAPKALRDVSGVTLCRNPLHAARRYNVGTDRFSTPNKNNREHYRAGSAGTPPH